MKTLTLISLMIIGSTALAAKSLPPKYLVNGQERPAVAAILAAMEGKTVYKCQLVEAKVSKAGTSVHLSNKKRK